MPGNPRYPTLPATTTKNYTHKRKITMPKVGKKKFPYTEAGMKDAKAYAKKIKNGKKKK